MYLLYILYDAYNSVCYFAAFTLETSGIKVYIISHKPLPTSRVTSYSKYYLKGDFLAERLLYV